MSIEPIEPVGQGDRTQQQMAPEGGSSDQGPGSFASVLDSAMAAGAAPDPGVASIPNPADTSAPTVAVPATVESVRPAGVAGGGLAVEPHPAVELLDRVGGSFDRLDALIAEVRTGQSFTPAEILGLMAEVHKLSIEVSATTKVASEAVSTVRTLLQQQV